METVDMENRADFQRAVRVDEAVRSRRDDSGNAAVQREVPGSAGGQVNVEFTSKRPFGCPGVLLAWNDPRGVIWKGFLMPRDPSHPWLCQRARKADGRGVIVIQELLELEYSIDAGRQRD
ncbi:hypothetical protein GQ600_24464 [Phytophthora cactorum]|nr:hypothetical protein GQ600_24464 [Phytophthora cactorum]